MNNRTPLNQPRSWVIPLTSRLILSFALLSAILAAIGGVFFFSLRSIETLHRAERSSASGEIAILHRVGKNIGLQQVEVFRHLGAASPQEKESHEQVIAGLVAMNTKALADYEQEIDNETERRLFVEVLEGQKAYELQTAQLFALSRAQRTAEAAILLFASQVLAFDRFQSSLEAMLRFEEAEEHAIAAATTGQIEHTRIVGDILIGLAIVIALGTGAAVSKIVGRLRRDKKKLRTEIAEHEKAEQALRESESRYRLLVDHSPDAIFVVCEDKIVFANPATVQLLGAERPEQLIGRAPSEIVHSADRAAVAARLKAVAEGKQAPTSDRRMLRLDGSTLEVEARAAAFSLEGKPAIQVIARDNTERKTAAARLDAQEKQYRLLFEDNPTPMWVYDVESLKFLEVNQAAISSYGFSREEFLCRTLRDIRPPEDVALLVKSISEASAPAGYGGEWRHSKKDGSIVIAAVYSSPTMFDNKEARMALAVDLTERTEAERKVRESEANLALAQQVAGVGSWEYQFTADGRIDQENLLWSEEAYRLFGLSSEHRITTESFFQAVHPDDRAIVGRGFIAFMEGKGTFKTEYRIVRPDGTERAVSAIAEKILDPGTAKPLKVVGTFLDITERRAVEKKLRDADEKYRAMFDNASEGIFQNTPEGVLISANPALARMLGFASPEELIRERNDLEQQSYVEPGKRAEFKRLLEEKGVVEHFEYEVKRKDGSTIWVSENVRIVRDDSGQALYYEGSAQDVTERKRAESSLIESQRRLDLARKAAQIGIWDWNVVTNELIWDEQMYDLYGVDERDFSGAYSAWQNGLHPDDRVTAEAEIMAAVKSADGFHTEFRVIRPDGMVRNIEAHAMAEHAPDGSTTRMIGVNFDITERKRIEGELQRQQSELQVLFDLMPAMLWFKDCENGIIRINRRVAEATGKAVEEIEGRSCSEIYPQHAAGYYADDLEVIRSGRPKLGIIERVSGKAEEALWVQTDKVPVFDPFGKVTGIVVMAQDVTERRKSEETLRLLNSAVLQSNEAILITDAELDFPGPRIVFANPAFTAMTGYEAAEVLGQTPRILQGPRTDRAVLARLRQTLTQGEVFKGEAINYRKDGTEFDLEWQIAPIRDANDNVTHFVALQRDITARRQTEQTQARFAAIMAATPDFVGVADGAGRMLYMNSAGRKMVGFTEDEDVTRTIIEDHVAKSQFPRLMEECIPTAIRDGAWSGEMTFVDRKGRETPLSQVIVTHKTPTGEIDFVATTAQDLTKRKKAETALEDANRQLLQASRLAGMAEVATSVLHNVGNVLNSVNVSCAVIADRVRGSRISSVARTAELLAVNSRDLPQFFANDPIGQKLPDFLGKLAVRLTAEQEEILGELQLLGQNIEHIKEIVAVQQNHAKDVGGVLEMLPIEGLVEDALRMNAGALLRHQIKVVREYGEAPPFSLEKHKVIQILVNLVRNAKHALTDGGRDDKRLLVRVARRNGNVAVSVSDNGIGIAPENKIRIFSHGFTTKKDGHGFGLHSGFLAAQEMGGSLVAQSDGPGLGATFTLELPLHGQGKN